jgi:hypothetical protein
VATDRDQLLFVVVVIMPQLPGWPKDDGEGVESIACWN